MMRMLGLVMCCSTAFPTTVWAQEGCPDPGAQVSMTIGAEGSAGAAVEASSAEDLETARRLAAEGRAALEAGDAELALGKLRRAYALSRDAVLLADVGFALEAEGDAAAAWTALQRYRLEADAMYRASPGRVDDVMGRLEARLGGVIVETEGDASAELWLDGHRIARLPMERPIFLAAGEARRLVVRVPGRGETDVEVDVTVGEIERVEADLDDLRPLSVVGGAVGSVTGLGGGLAGSAPDASPDLDADVDEDAGLSPWFFVAGGVGLAVVAGAIVATVVHGNLSGDFDAMGCGGSSPGPECPSLESDVSLASTLQVGGFVLGGLALAGAGLIFALSGSAETEEELDCPTTRIARGCTPLIGPDGAGAACSLSF